jgi:hypothetical protein
LLLILENRKLDQTNPFMQWKKAIKIWGEVGNLALNPKCILNQKRYKILPLWQLFSSLH